MIPTAGEFRTMNGRKCEAVTHNGKTIKGEILIEDGDVYIIHDNPDADGDRPNQKIDGYSWIIVFDKYRYDDYITDCIKLIHFFDDLPKVKRTNYTYTTQYIRSDGIVFTQDAIDGISIEDLQQQEKDYIADARRVRGLLNSHKAKF